MCSPPLVPGGGAHSLAGEGHTRLRGRGRGGPNSDAVTHTLWYPRVVAAFIMGLQGPEEAFSTFLRKHLALQTTVHIVLFFGTCLQAHEKTPKINEVP
jgi:hypothetical protein